MTQKTKSNLRLGFYVLLAGLLVVTVVTQHNAFVDALRAAGHANRGLVAAGIVLFTLSLIFSTFVYMLLAGSRLRFGQTLLVQAGGMFANKLLPAGSGAIGVSYLYLRRQGIGKELASAVVACNNLLGVVGHNGLLILCLLIQPAVIKQVHLQGHLYALYGVIAGLMVLAAVMVYIVPSLRRSARNFGKPVRQLLNHKFRLLAALGLSLCITFVYATSLYIACRSLGVHLAPLQTFVVLTAGVFAASAVPTPGGIGSAEAGIYAGLKLYGVSHDLAIAAAVLFRLITFWAPLGYGAVCFIVVSRAKLLTKL